MICSFCAETIFGSGKTWDFHHASRESLESSIQSRCALCLDLGDCVDHESPFPTHRWSLRRAAKAREVEEVVVLTFRPTQCAPSPADKTFYLIPESDMESNATFFPLGRSTNSEESWQQVSRWMKTCLESHPKCNARRLAHRDFMPTRLLDVGTPEENWPPSSVKLVESSANGIRAPYVTLSHCWGPPEKTFVRLESSSMQDFLTHGVEWKELCSNRNFEHAVEVARRLGVRYLWVDSLCIIQGPAGVHDWQAEAPLMHHVYRNAHVNIAASDSRDGDGGLFHDRVQILGELVPTHHVSRTNGPFLDARPWRIFPRDLWTKQLLGSWLYTRGWVFQERMLSPRIVHFGRHQIFWDCATISACETVPTGLPGPLDERAAIDRHWRERLQQPALSVRPLGGSADDSLDRFWRSAVRTYTSCNLTNVSDKLRAIWGVAKLVRDALDEDYGEGLFANNLCEQLAWTVVECRDPKSTRRNAMFPSWTWTSVNGTVELSDRWPDLPRFYTAQNHDGGVISFDIDKVLHPIRSKSDDWEDELSAMGSRLQQIAEDRTSTSFAPGSTERPWLNPRSDVPPLLKTRPLAIQGHVGRGILVNSEEAGGWQLQICGAPPQLISLKVFPDSTPATNESAVHFLLLAVSRQVQGDGYFGLDDDDDEDIEVEYQYSGIGLLLQSIGMDRFQRIGALAFRDLGAAGWQAVRIACGEDDERLSTDMHPTNGKKIFLE